MTSNKNTIIYGKHITVEPKERPTIDMDLKYMPMNEAHPAEAPERMDEKSWMNLFLKNAFFLYEHRAAIYSDDRMFNTPVPFNNNLSYTGTFGFKEATLGVYLYWWEDCTQTILRNESGTIRALTFFIAGDPKTGENQCAAIRTDGTIETVRIDSFSNACYSFISFNEGHKARCNKFRIFGPQKVFTLEETLDELYRKDK